MSRLFLYCRNVTYFLQTPKTLCVFLMLVILTLLPLGVFAEESLVTMNVIDANVRDILTALARIGQVNLIVDDSVTGKVTVQLTDVSFENALDIITKIKGLAYQRLGNVLIVGSNTAMGRNFGSVSIFKLQYAEAAAAANTLGVILEERPSEVTAAKNAVPEISKPSNKLARLKVDEATNSLVFNGSLSETAQIRKILDEIDVPYQQVSLEAQVLSVNKSDAKNLGIEWNWSQTPSLPNYTASAESYETTDANGNVVKRLRDKTTIDRSKSSPFSGAGGIIRFGNVEGHPYELYYQAKINALLTQDRANILAKPKITTINGQEAIIDISDSVAVPASTTTSNGITNSGVTYKDVGIKLRYTPRINKDGYITAIIHAEVSSLGTYNSSLNAYNFYNRSADTQVRLKDGETMVIGGLIDSEEAKGVKKIPWLGDLPIFGALFKSVSKNKTDKEIIIFLTARIVK